MYRTAANRGRSPRTLHAMRKVLSNRRGSTLAIVMIVLAVIVIGGFILFGTNIVSGEDEQENILTYDVTKGPLVVTVTEDGNLESASNKELKSQVKGGSSILFIVEDGTRVEAGELLVELDSSGIESQLDQQKIVVEKARASKIQAETDWEVAKISIKEYLEGIFKKDMQLCDGNITIAKENLSSAENSLEYTQRMMRKGYATQLQLESQAFAVERAKLDLAAAETDKEILVKFSKVKTLTDLEAKRDAAEAKMLSEQVTFKAEGDTLTDLEGQMDFCKIVAPQSGMVVYANQRSRWGQQGAQIEEGASVRERQSIIKLPDLTQMQVKVTVHESKVESLRRGMRANLKIQDRELQGTVVRIATQPEPGGFMSANIKEYATIVKIDGTPEDLKPGMTAAVEILVAKKDDVLTIPVQCIVETGKKFYCWVQTEGNEVEKREVILGPSNDKVIEVKDGLNEGDQVLLNPRATQDDARDTVVIEEDVDTDKKFGELKEPLKEEAQPRKRGGGGGGGGGRRGGGFDLMQYDSNSDGKVSKDEAPERMREFFDRMDPNSDGFIDAKEIADMRRRFGGGRRGGGGGGRRGQREEAAESGSEEATESGSEEAAESGSEEAAGGGQSRRQFNLMDYDKDGDGKVSKDEAPERMRSFFDRMDPNSDGFIDAKEIEDMTKRFRAGGAGGAGGGGGQN
ncbi:MAG: HlyD family efflux transporter periplasmic adaptor subunit [Planctomycetota bacterium]|nr:HlyD family efflux transporter periplasmic adaptor subunit [Planctomycetota bacterium]